MRRLVVCAAAAALAVGMVVAAAPASATDSYVVVEAGRSLHAGDRVISSNQAYVLTVQTDGNVVERHGATAVWATVTPGNPGATLDVQSDGNLVVRSSSGRALWNSGSAGHQAMHLLLEDDGGLGMYASTGPAFWSNGVGSSTPRATLAAGQSVRSANSDRLYSPSGRFQVYPLAGAVAADESVGGVGATMWIRGTPQPSGQSVLTMQTDGNLVVRGTNGVAYWSTGTRGAGNRFSVQDDGNLVVRRSNGSAAWTSGTRPVLLGRGETAGPGARFSDLRYSSRPASTTVVQSDGNVVRRGVGNTVEWATGTAGNTGARLTMQTDGNLVVRRPDGRAVWQSGTSRCGSSVFNTSDGFVISAAGRVSWQEAGDRTGVC